MCRQTLEDVQALFVKAYLFSVASSGLHIRRREPYNTGIKREATNLELLRSRECFRSSPTHYFTTA